MSNCFLKHRSDENRRLFQKQRNKCVSLLQKAKKEYFSSLNINKVVDNKSFWKIVKPFLSNKAISSEKITIIDEVELVTDEQKVANTLNDFFSSIVTSLNLPESQNADPFSDNIDHLALKAIMKWRNNPSVLAITTVRENRERFTFSSVTLADVAKEINNLNSTKAIQEADIPVKLLKYNNDFFAAYIAKYFNVSLKGAKFPNCLKLASITPVFKKNSCTSKNNYRPGSVLPVISKIFERIICIQLSAFFEEIFSKFQCDFRKGYSTQYCLLMMFESWKEAADKNKTFGALMTDLSKSFDCLSHDLLITKLHAYGTDLFSLKLLQGYLPNRWQRTKVDSKFSSWKKIISGVPQGSILGPVLFNIFICDMFMFLHEAEFTGYAGDNTPFAVRDNIPDVISALEEIGEKLVIWFSDNQMKLNTDKCHLLLNTQDQNFLNIGNFNIKNSFYKNYWVLLLIAN